MSTPPLVVLHGSPGARTSTVGVARALSRARPDVIVVEAAVIGRLLSEVGRARADGGRLGARYGRDVVAASIGAIRARRRRPIVVAVELPDDGASALERALAARGSGPTHRVVLQVAAADAWGRQCAEHGSGTRRDADVAGRSRASCTPAGRALGERDGRRSINVGVGTLSAAEVATEVLARVALPGTPPAPPRLERGVARTILARVAEMFSTGEGAAAADLFDAAYLDHQRPADAPARGPEEFVAVLHLARRYLPGLVTEATPLDVLATHGLVAGVFHWTSETPAGVHERETLEVLHVVDDRVVEHWGTELARTLTPLASPDA